MSELGDHVGKPKTASAVDHEHYPEMKSHPGDRHPTNAEISKFAHDLWVQRGSPPNSSERDWLEAEEQLRQAQTSRTQLEALNNKGGSVQP